MTKHYTTIDVDPVNTASELGGSSSTPTATYTAPSFGKRAEQAAAQVSATNAHGPQVTPATVIGVDPTPSKKPNRIGGAVQTAVGGAIALVGIPMLILPGPGLIAIGGGAAIAAGGIKKLLGK